jgi:hypothetical protein
LCSNTRKLLAHSEGYWYLVDEDEGNLLIVRDHDDRTIQVPRYVEIVDDPGALKVEVPAEWDEDISRPPRTWEDHEGILRHLRIGGGHRILTVSTNADNYGEGWIEPGIVVEAARYPEEIERSYPLDAILDRNGGMYRFAGTSCQHQGRDDYEGNGYEGKIDRYSCPEEGTFLAVLAATPNDDRRFVVVAELQMPMEDQGKEDHILSSVEVKDELLPY